MTPSRPSERLEELTNDFERVLADYLADVCAEPVANLHDAMAYALGADIEEEALPGTRSRPDGKSRTDGKPRASPATLAT